VGLIQTLLNNQLETPPFQIDLMIVPQNPCTSHDTQEQTDTDANDVDADGDDDEEFEDEPEDEDSDEEKADAQEQSAQPDEIGDIHARLKSADVTFEYKEQPERSELYRAMRTMFETFTKSGHSVAKRKLDNLSHAHRRRFVVVVDRRLKAEDSSADSNVVSDRNEIYLYVPPMFGDMPAEHVRQWGCEASAQSVLPGKSVKDAIRSKSVGKGMVNVFSFHVEQAGEVVCYFYRNGQILRLLPKDILEVLPHMFEMDQLNKEWVAKTREGKDNISSKADDKGFVEKLTETWTDEHFARFRAEMKEGATAASASR